MINFLEKRKLQKELNKVNSYDDEFSKLSDNEIKRYSRDLMERAKNGESKESLLPESFALAREASFRVLRKKHYDVQVIGGIVLNSGNVAEMSTGSGKSILVDEELPTPKGFKKAGDMKVGEYLFSKNGLATELEGVFPQGELPVYNVILDDDRVLPCSLSHIWGVYEKTNEGVIYKEITTKEILSEGLRDEKGKPKFSIPLVSPVNYPKNETVNNFYEYGANLFRNQTVETRIDENLKISSVEQRKQLLKAFMDESIKDYKPVEGKKYTPMIGVNNEGFREDILEIIYSLGLSAKKVDADSGRFLIKFKYPSKHILNYFGEDTAKLSNFNLDEYKDQDLTLRNYIFIDDIVDTGEVKEQVCFTVKDPEHLFVASRGYIVTHNTLTEVLPAYLNALDGKGVHIITVNDYLAKRDMEEMGKIFKFLGLTVSWIYPQMDLLAKKKAYECDIVYGTNNLFGFDYLRDNMVDDKKNRAQRELNYCIIDEVDSILIDEARTPLIISKPGAESSTVYTQADIVAKMLERGEDEKEINRLDKMDMEENLSEEEIEARKDFQINEKNSTINLTDRGVAKIEKYFGIENLGSDENVLLYHHILQAIRANYLMKNNVDYINKNGEIIIVDTSTGRTMEGRRFSEGLHQAIEAKEGVEIKSENDTAATITLQNYFRLYNKISGMTGTAKTEEREFKEIYDMKVVTIPDHKPKIRIDNNDIVFYNNDVKEEAVYQEAKKMRELGRPVLIGTSSVKASERLHEYFKSKEFNHELLNAKSTLGQSLSAATREAVIIAQAGQSGSVTIATNMAGRGTDILLGGNPEFLAVRKMVNRGYSEDDIEKAKDFTEKDTEKDRAIQAEYQEILAEEEAKCLEDKNKVIAAGGLCVIGTEKHDSRRIDNQLRGRAGRQGDPGSSVFMISLEDRLFKLFGGSALEKSKEAIGFTDEPISTGGLLNKQLNKAQKSVEGRDFEQRKHVLEYDEIDNVQRSEVYKLRNMILDSEDISEYFELFYNYGVKKINSMTNDEILNDPILEVMSDDLVATDNRDDVITSHVNDLFEKILNEGVEEKFIDELKTKNLLYTLDENWKVHLIRLQNLKDAVSMSGVSQKQPIDNYKEKAMDLFEEFKQNVGKDMLGYLSAIKVAVEHI